MVSRLFRSIFLPGVNATTGEIPGVAIKPEKTVTLTLPKKGLTPENSGTLILADIGIHSEVFKRANIEYTSPFGSQFRIPLHCKRQK